MAESPDIAEMMRRAVQLNARLYKGWVDLSMDYFKGLAEIFAGEQPQETAEEAEPEAGALVLEGDAGAAAKGAFLVTNDLGRNLSCELVASDFTDRTGGRAAAQVKFEPPRFELAPGEQRVVQVVLPIGSELSPGVAYSGEFSIRGLDGFAVPVVVRRTHGVEDATDEKARTASGAQGASGTTGKATASAGAGGGAQATAAGADGAAKAAAVGGAAKAAASTAPEAAASSKSAGSSRGPKRSAKQKE